MASQFIGLIVGAVTGAVYSVLNPDDDAQLDNPRHLLLQNEQGEPIRMVKVDRGDYSACMSMDDVQALVSRYHAVTGLSGPMAAHDHVET